MQKHVAALSGL